MSRLSSCNQSLTPETYAAMKNQWIDYATPDVAHYGLKCHMDYEGLTTGERGGVKDGVQFERGTRGSGDCGGWG